nr:hypothetical protein [uncultured Neisseria sp.]
MEYNETYLTILIWWIINVSLVWFKARKWHIKILLAGTVLFLIQMVAVAMIIGGLGWMFETKVGSSKIVAFVINPIFCWLLVLWLGKHAMKVCLKTKDGEGYIAPPLATAWVGVVIWSCILLFIFFLLTIFFNLLLPTI